MFVRDFLCVCVRVLHFYQTTQRAAGCRQRCSQLFVSKDAGVSVCECLNSGRSRKGAGVLWLSGLYVCVCVCVDVGWGQ